MKRLRVIKEDSCIGCKICALYASLSKSDKVDLDSSFVKIVRDGKKFKILLDQGTKTDYPVVVNSCPRGCFDLEEIVDTNES
ncbi:hypothetical protein GW755_01885 [bacterium]|nr:hypothetical protein [bacterium]